MLCITIMNSMLNQIWVLVNGELRDINLLQTFTVIQSHSIQRSSLVHVLLPIEYGLIAGNASPQRMVISLHDSHSIVKYTRIIIIIHNTHSTYHCYTIVAVMFCCKVSLKLFVEVVPSISDSMLGSKAHCNA